MTESRGTAITGISSMATRNLLAELANAYERKSGQAVAILSVGGVEAARRIDDGELFDFAVLAEDAIEILASKGRVDPGSRTEVARSAMAIAVPAGTPRPRVVTEAEVRAAVLGARRIGYSTGPSGVHLLRLLERWGIAAEMTSRMVQASPGVPVGSLVARGAVAMGFQQLSELMNLPDIDVIGALPTEIQAVTTFSAAICTASTRATLARAFLAFLASPEVGAMTRRHGMEPPGQS